MITDIHLEPMSGAFEVAAIEQFIEQLPFARRDLHHRPTFIVAPDEETLDEVIAAREADATNFLTSVTLIAVFPHRIDLAYRLEPLESCRSFVSWLRDHYQIKILDEDFNDVTANVDPGLVYLFGSP